MAPVSSTSRFATGERVVARIVNRSVVNDAKQKAHTMYVVNVWRETRPTTPWVVYRRYSDFLDLHDRLKKKGLVLPAFPGKKVLGLFDDSFLDKRQAALGMWLDNVTNTYSALSSVDRDRVDEVRIFLTRDANMKPQGFGASKASAAAAAAAASPKAATTSSSSSSSRSSRKSKKKVGLHSFELLKGNYSTLTWWSHGVLTMDEMNCCQQSLARARLARSCLHARKAAVMPPTAALSLAHHHRCPPPTSA